MTAFTIFVCTILILFGLDQLIKAVNDVNDTLKKK